MSVEGLKKVIAGAQMPDLGTWDAFGLEGLVLVGALVLAIVGLSGMRFLGKCVCSSDSSVSGG